MTKSRVSQKVSQKTKEEKKVIKFEKPKKVADTELIKATIRKDFKSDIDGVETCKACNGEGFIETSKGKVMCSACGGAGITYTPPVRVTTGRSTGEISKSKVKAKSEPAEIIKTEVVKKEIKFKSFKHGKDTYLVSREVMVLDGQVPNLEADGEIEDCMDKLLKPYYKRLGVQDFKGIKGNLKSVQGVRYKVERECEKFSLSGKPTGIKEYVKSGLKFSNKIWIDTKYLEIFNNHRFIYLNPLSEKDTLIPVLAIDKTSGKLEGMMMPLAQ